MECIKCGHSNALLKRTCENCGEFLVGETINNVTGKWGRRNADGSFTPKDDIPAKEINPSPGWHPFNANNEVKVRLTDEGKRILAKHYGGAIPGWFKNSYVVKDGWWRFQFHDLANIFGESLHMGNMKLPFEMNMMIYLDK